MSFAVALSFSGIIELENKSRGRQLELEREMMKAILRGSATRIMLLGGADTGKTTLVEAIADRLSRAYRTGILDLDMGQSHIGPPTTLGFGMLKGGFKGWGRIRPAGIYFTGATSPVGNLLPLLVGARLLLDRALKQCERVVIDTTGLISGPIGRVLKQHKIDLLKPDLVIAIERAGELGDILDAYRYEKRPRVLRLRASDLAIQKTVIKRSDWRAQRFREYFEGARALRIDTGSMGLRFTRDVEAEGLEERLVSFRGKAGRDIALGYVIEADIDKGMLVVRTPLKKGIAFSTLVIGMAKVEL